jgi:hypothetical protein
MEIKGNEALTPNKKQFLIEQINGELNNANESIQEGDFSAVSLSIINKAKSDLQSVLNKFLEKKGVITPSETADAIEKINALKRARLEQDYVLGIKRGTWFIIAVVGLSVGMYFYYKKISK